MSSLLYLLFVFTLLIDYASAFGASATFTGSAFGVSTFGAAGAAGVSVFGLRGGKFTA
jgi:hypothetical protein